MSSQNKVAVTHSHSFDRIIYLLQGGGALGAYQVGVIKGLLKNGYTPQWLIATSIGSINSAIIAGNKPEECVQKLEGFWDAIATKMPAPFAAINNVIFERYHHFLSTQFTECFGQPGFFEPRWYNPWWSMQSTVDKLSYYDTNPLRDTLLRFINFDLINEKKTRLSIGAVRVARGQLVYFDNTKMEIKPEHIMASAALPPAFPAVNIDGSLYWDGGVHSNTQVNLMLTDNQPLRSLCFMVHLFDSYGTKPTTMDDVLKREKDIRYSSHHREFILAYQNLHNLKCAIRMLSEQIPEEKKSDPELKKLMALGKDGIIHLARFHYKGKLSDLSTKDCEFSTTSLAERIRCGYDDVCKTLRNPPWYETHPENLGLIVHELSDDPLDKELEYF